MTDRKTKYCQIYAYVLQKNKKILPVYLNNNLIKHKLKTKNQKIKKAEWNFKLNFFWKILRNIFFWIFI